MIADPQNIETDVLIVGACIFLEISIAGDFIDTLITRTQNICVGDPSGGYMFCFPNWEEDI